ncbi:hypothetical protein EB796_005089 [Bugula neritina]|uniref:Uncharacterized protein n=1 Tax=Bugula neritina TaxID=10212 RepID=A0A7J7KD68_BUGNE|nr:hypothetical protein EB796_005089 [Bugula neritina]
METFAEADSSDVYDVENEKLNETHLNTPDHSVDEGYAWVILAISFFINTYLVKSTVASTIIVTARVLFTYKILIFYKPSMSNNQNNNQSV